MSDTEFQLPEAVEAGQVYFHEGVCYVVLPHSETGALRWYQGGRLVL